MICDICTASGDGTTVPARQMSNAVREGFNPFYNGCIPESMSRLAAAGYPKRWAESAISGETSHSGIRRLQRRSCTDQRQTTP